MTRVKSGVQTKRRHKKVLKEARRPELENSNINAKKF